MITHKFHLKNGAVRIEKHALENPLGKTIYEAIMIKQLIEMVKEMNVLKRNKYKREA